MAQFQVPTVTIDDLLQFQAKHFPHDEPYPAPDYTFAPEDSLAEEDEDVDGLGYYEDGVKRTLTDEQIRIFRHSEIHALLRERQQRQELEAEEAWEPSKPADPGSSPASPEAPVIDAPARNVSSMKRGASQADISSTQKRMKKTADGGESIEVTYEDIQYDENNSWNNSVPNGPSSSQPSFTGRRIISYDD